jgi:hypothetical protein
MLLIQGEVSPRRFMGRWKDFGPCYTRGIIEGNGNPPGNDMWVTYSMNKEDIWVSRIPLPVRYSVEGDIYDNFNDLQTGGAVPDWNIYSPQWAPVEVTDFPSPKNKSLLLIDKDPYDYARTIRVFKETEKSEIEFRIFPENTDTAPLEIDVTDRYGNRPVRIRFDLSRIIMASDGSKETAVIPFKTGLWYDLKLTVDANPYGSYSLWINGKELLKNAALAEAVTSVERISFRTGAYRDLPDRTTPNQEDATPLERADVPVTASEYYVDDLKIKSY